MSTLSIHSATPELDAHGISTEVPDDLWLAVFIGQLDEQIAVERGRRAAQVASEEQRHAILFETITPHALRKPPYRPVGSPPWGEP